jgi:murein DD-endopeptidase / murein LD-carboxypeptidase
MLVKKTFQQLTCATLIIIGSLLTGCESSQQLLEPRLSLKPRPAHCSQFLNNIALAGNTSKGKINNSVASTPINVSATPKAEEPSFAHLLQVKYASLLGIVPQAVTNLPLYNFIENWYGVRYRMGGKDQKGIDCSAFVQRLYENVFCTNLVRTAMDQFHMCQYVMKTDSLKEGDLVFFRNRGKRISHVGIYLANNFFVHASSSQGVIISSLNEGYWSRFYAGAGKVLVCNSKN